MPYITVRQNQVEQQLSWDDIISDRTRSFVLPYNKKCPTGTITRFHQNVPEKWFWNVDYGKIVRAFQVFNEKHEALFNVPRGELYHRFYIPKRHGGKREINEPNPELMAALNELRYILEEVCGVLYHTAAFAYVKGRSIVDMDMRHARNESNWFLKTDFEGFFPNTTLDFVLHMMSKIYPFSEMMDGTPRWKDDIRKAMSLAFLDGGLPQGSPVSPTISNMMMIPIDHKLFNALAEKRFVYTRYADDITISCQQTFNYKEIIKLIKDTLTSFDAPFTLKDEKTKYVNNKGANWMLGLMLNKDHQVTVGHERKKYMKASLCNFVMDWKHGKIWSPEDVMEVNGEISYYQMVEKEYVNYVINHMNQKFSVDIRALLKAGIAGKLA